VKVLVACEFSGVVRDAFASRGHYAMSCHLQQTEKPGNHYCGNVIDVLHDGWDLLIAHPPCTFLSKAGARWLYTKPGKIDAKRYAKGMDAKLFFMQLLEAPIAKIDIENPMPLKVFGLPKPQQIIEPFHYGHKYSKKTCLWLRGLPPLMRTVTVVNYGPFLPSNTGGKSRGTKTTKGIAQTKNDRSRTFAGVAQAMAQQWGAK